MEEEGSDELVDTYAGVGVAGRADGPRLEASFSAFWACSLAPRGGVYVADFSNHTIRLIDAKGAVSTFAGTGHASFSDGQRRLAAFHNPAGLCLAANGDLLISDKNNNRIRLIDASDNVSTVAGLGQSGADDGPCDQATFHSPVGLCESPMGILVADWFNQKIRLISGGLVSTFAGTGNLGASNGTRLNAAFAHPVGVCINRLGEVFVADRNNHRIRVIRANGEVENYAGCGERGWADGPSTDARFTYPWSLCMSPFGDLIVADEYNHRIRVVNPSGSVSTLAGNGNKDNIDGPRHAAAFAYPACVCISPQGEIFVADRDNYKVRRIRVDKWAIEAVSNYKKLSLIGLRHSEALSDITLRLQSTNSWKLHSPIIAMRCPQLVEETTQEQLRSLNVSNETIDGLLNFIYDDRLPRLSLAQLCELDRVAGVIGMSNFSRFIRQELRKALAAPHTADELLALMEHVVKHCECDMHLVDIIVAPLRAQRSEVALKLGRISEWLLPTDPRFMEIVSKVMGDFDLPALEQPELEVFDELQRELFGLYSQIEARAALDASAASESSSSSVVRATFPSGPTSTASKTKFADWWEPDFVLKVDNVRFRCHKWIVCGRWSYMRDAMIFGGTESETAEMDLPVDSFQSPRLLQSFLRYLYTNQTDQFETEDDCISILRLAREFKLIDSENKDVPGFGVLLDRCRSVLIIPLTNQNCISQYKKVLEYGSEDQQTTIRSYLITHMHTLASDLKQAAELESLGPRELVKLLEAISRHEHKPPPLFTF